MLHVPVSLAPIHRRLTIPWIHDSVSVVPTQRHRDITFHILSQAKETPGDVACPPELAPIILHEVVGGEDTSILQLCGDRIA